MKHFITVTLMAATLTLFAHPAGAANGLQKRLTGHGYSDEGAYGDFLGQAKAYCSSQGYKTYYPMPGQSNQDGTEYTAWVTCVNDDYETPQPANGPTKRLTGHGYSEEGSYGDFLGKASAYCKSIGYNNYYPMPGQSGQDETEYTAWVTCVNTTP